MTHLLDTNICSAHVRRPAGQFVTRLSPELHRQVTLAATGAGKSLNAWVTEQLQASVSAAGKQSLAKKAKQRKATNSKPSANQQTGQKSR